MKQEAAEEIIIQFAKSYGSKFGFQKPRMVSQKTDPEVVPVLRNSIPVPTTSHEDTFRNPMGFDQVTEGVAKIQGCSESGFGFVLSHDSCLHPAGPENRFFQKIQIQDFQFSFLKKIKQFPVMRQPMLCQFEVTCLEFTGGQGFRNSRSMLT